MNGGIDKILKNKKMEGKKENWRVMGGGEGNLFYHFFYITGVQRRKESDREQIKKERGKKKRVEHH